MVHTTRRHAQMVDPTQPILHPTLTLSRTEVQYAVWRRERLERGCAAYAARVPQVRTLSRTYAMIKPGAMSSLVQSQQVKRCRHVS